MEGGQLVRIVEIRFNPTHIYRLLVIEKKQAESQPRIEIAGVLFQQTERDGKESEYNISRFFKAWAAYSEILVKLAPQALQRELATALVIYTMNLYDLMEKYTWDGVKAYHFQFQRKQVAGGNRIYYPNQWQQSDSELIASRVRYRVNWARKNAGPLTISPPCPTQQPVAWCLFWHSLPLSPLRPPPRPYPRRVPVKNTW